MNLSDFYYDLPAAQIAQEPVAQRDQSRLLVVNAETQMLVHRHFRDIGDYLRPGDALVLNATKVFPARLRGRKKTGGKIELLLLDRIPSSPGETWRALVRGSTTATELEFPENLTGFMQRRLSEGEWEIQFSGPDVRQVLERHGEMPLPPYIKRPEPQAKDLARYQTVFAKQEGAVAAPTAGFHFTPTLLQDLRQRGIQILEIVLHVGWGTFRPVRTETIEEHRMLAERYEVSAATADALNATRLAGHRVVAVGTTAVRTLESIADDTGRFSAGSGETSIFIYPGYCFKGVDALITNFHLPDSTPLLLANAFYSYKKNSLSRCKVEEGAVFSLRPAYEAAIREKYRFYSYGDAMVIA